MKKEVLYGIVGLVIGAAVSGLAVANLNSPDDVKKDGSMTMADMVSSFKHKTGDDFDKDFISGMIEHHQGAVDMAELAKENAKHDEIKKMADDIIVAQSKEIDMMQMWQGDWGYKSVLMGHDTVGR